MTREQKSQDNRYAFWMQRAQLALERAMPYAQAAIDDAAYNQVAGALRAIDPKAKIEKRRVHLANIKSARLPPEAIRLDKLKASASASSSATARSQKS